MEANVRLRKGKLSKGLIGRRCVGRTRIQRMHVRITIRRRQRVNAHRMLRTSYTPAAAEGAASTTDFSDNFISRIPASTTEESPVLRSRYKR